MEKDLVDYVYLSDNLRYADLFNGVLFGGEEVVVANRLKGEDTKLVVSSGAKKKGRYRDVIRKYENDVDYAVLGIENQEKVNYAMPFRIMEYESGTYAKQMAEFARMHKKQKDVSDEEYLSKLKKTDRLKPCITLVLYWGEHWDGPKALKDMMNLNAVPEPMWPYVNDYRIHVVNVREFSDTSVFKTDLKLVFDFMKQTKNRAGMRALLLGNEEYRSVSREAFEVMRIHTNLTELDKFIEEKIEKDGEVVDMCQAIREMMEEEREQGMEKGIEQGILLHIYKMVERGKYSVKEALEDLQSNQKESDFIEAMVAAGYKLP